MKDLVILNKELAMYEKLEELRESISNLEIEESERSYMLDIIDDIERELDIQDSAYNYLSDEDNYEW